MKHRKRFLMLPTILSLLFWQACAAGGGYRPAPDKPSLDRVIHEMERVRRGIEDLVVHIEVVSFDRVSGRQDKTRVELKFKRPDRLISEIVEPEGRLTVINGDRMWIYSPDIGVVEKYSLEDERKREAVLYEMSWGLTSPIRALLRGMNRRLEVLDDGKYLIVVEPDREDFELKRLEAVVDPADWLIERMLILPAGRDPVEVWITRWDPDPGLDDDLFEFQIPEGAAVFEALE